MKAFTVAAALSFGLLTVPALAQQKPPVAKPPATPAQPTQRPTTPPVAQPAQPPKPFPEGAKIAYVSLQDVSRASKEGQNAAKQIEALQTRKLKEIDDKRKQIEANNTLLQSPTLADDKRAALQKEVDRGNTDLQRMQQDAQAEMQELNAELQRNFLGKVNPIINALATEKGLQMLFLKEESGLYWSDPALDLTAEVARRLDAATPGTAPKPPDAN